MRLIEELAEFVTAIAHVERLNTEATEPAATAIN